MMAGHSRAIILNRPEAWRWRSRQVRSVLARPEKKSVLIFYYNNQLIKFDRDVTDPLSRKNVSQSDSRL